MKHRFLVATLAVTMVAAGPLRAEWVSAWQAPMQGSMGSDRPRLPAIDKVQLQQIIRVSASGPRIRIRFSNEANNAPLTLGLIRVVRINDSGAMDPKSARIVKLLGLVDGAIPTKGVVTSETIDLPVKALDRLLIAIQVPGLVERPTLHRAAMAETIVALLPGAAPHPEATPTPSAPDAPPAKPRPPVNPTEGVPVKHGMRYFITAVDVDSPAPVKAIVALGDSITDGINSSINADRRWTDVLEARIVAAKLPLSVVNAGISGNRVIKGGTGTPMLARLDRDALSSAGVGYIMLLGGVNDIANAERDGNPPGSAPLIDAYKQMIAKAHAKGLKMIGGTITPYKGAKNWTDAGEKVRGEVNAWIRAPGNFDGVVDFDKAVRDPATPAQMLRGNHGGDFLHPNDTGYRLMGESVDLAVFK